MQSSIIPISQFAGTANVPMGVLSELPQSNLFPGETKLTLTASDFNYRLVAPIIETSTAKQKVSIIRTRVDDDVVVIFTFSGIINEIDSEFIGRFYLGFELSDRRPRAHYVANSLMALFSLSQKLTLKFSGLPPVKDIHTEISLSEISKILRRRQLALKLMVIEKATRKELPLPFTFSEIEAATISYVYQAIVDRAYLKAIEEIETSMKASKEWLKDMPVNNHPIYFESLPEELKQNIFDQEISLGKATMIIEDMIFCNPSNVQQEMQKNDGHLFTTHVRSLSGQAKLKFPAAPRLPKSSWDAEIQKLIDLEKKFALSLAARYHALAASTLANLTEEEKREITSRPTLDEDAYLMND